MTNRKTSLYRNFFYEYLLLWIFPVVFKGAKNQLHPEDVPELPGQLKSEMVIPIAIESWKKHHSLLRVIWDVAKRDLIIGFIASVVSGLLTVVLRPLLLGLIVDNLSIPENQDKTLKLIGCLVVVLMFEGLSVVTVKHAISDIVGHTMFTAWSGLIQQKLQKIPVSSRTSQELGLIGNDIFRVYENLRFSSMLIIAFTGFIGGIVVLVIQIGRASFVGLGVMWVIFGINIFLARKASIAEERDLEAADKRLQLLRQMITGIKAIKLCAWEESFLKRIRAARTNEMVHLRRFRLYSQSGVQVGRASPIVSAASAFLFLAISGEEVTAGKLFSALNVFLSLRLALIVIPESVTIAAAAKVSLTRIHRYLMEEEVEKRDITEKNSDDFEDIKKVEEPEMSLTNKAQPGLTISGSFVWPDSSEFVLDLTRIKLKLPRGKSLAVVSKVGHGKTTFLHALLGELKECKKYETDNSANLKNMHEGTAFIPQQPFILGGTVVENITLSTEKVSENDSLLQTAIFRSALTEDLELLTNGMQTIIGERGINFSGGQQMRVAVARAVYRCLALAKGRKGILGANKGTLLVVDDALAAVDVNVADHLFHSAFMQHLQDYKGENSLVMALNQPKYLKYFDYVAEIQNGHLGNFLPVNEENLQKIGFLTSNTQTILVKNEAKEMDEAQENKKTEENGNSNKDDLYEEDMNATGAVSYHVLKTYVNSIGIGFLMICFSCGVITYAAMAFTDLWFSYWVEEIDQRIPNPDSLTAQEYREANLRFVAVYAGSCLLFLFCLLLTSSLFTFAGVKGSKNLHRDCIDKLLHCPISFFEKTPSGRIISRFTSDMSAVDLNLTRFIDNLWQLMATLLAQIVVVAILVWPMIIVILISIVLYSFQVIAADRANRVVKRENNLAMGPLQFAISENIDAKVTSRLMNYNDYFNARFYSAMDNWNKFGFASMGVINTSMLISYALSLIISTSSALFIVFTESLSPALSGLALTYSFLIPYFLLNCGFVFTIVMSAVNSLERVVDYSSDKLPQEPPWFLNNVTNSSKGTAKQRGGKIEFRNVTLIYRAGLDPALINLSFTINAGEKIGLIGRTGAGKSSVILLLLRILDPTNGAVLIDDVDIKTQGLLELRRAISIIPQTPLLLKGTIQDNIAPFGKAPFDQMKDAVIESGLFHSFPHRFSKNKTKVVPTLSSAEISDTEIRSVLNVDAESLSAGQKQLLSLTRCLLSNENKILICDEPTSNVDMATDKIVQQVVREKFKHATIITVAHRLETIADTDRIIVLDKGQVKQIDKPSVILKTEVI